MVRRGSAAGSTGREHSMERLVVGPIIIRDARESRQVQRVNENARRTWLQHGNAISRGRTTTVAATPDCQCPSRRQIYSSGRARARSRARAGLMHRLYIGSYIRFGLHSPAVPIRTQSHPLSLLYLIYVLSKVYNLVHGNVRAETVDRLTHTVEYIGTYL